MASRAQIMMAAGIRAGLENPGRQFADLPEDAQRELISRVERNMKELEAEWGSADQADGDQA